MVLKNFIQRYSSKRGYVFLVSPFGRGQEEATRMEAARNALYVMVLGVVVERVGSGDWKMFPSFVSGLACELHK